jgi:hypothetical protein
VAGSSFRGYANVVSQNSASDIRERSSLARQDYRLPSFLPLLYHSNGDHRGGLLYPGSQWRTLYEWLVR